MSDEFTRGWEQAQEEHKSLNVTTHRSQGDSDWDRGWNAFIDQETEGHMDRGEKLKNDWFGARDAEPVEVGSFKVAPLPSQPAGENPFWHDHFHMGTMVNKDVCILFHDVFDSAENRTEYLIVVDIKTGRKLKVQIAE